jgi:hypothetical protein
VYRIDGSAGEDRGGKAVVAATGSGGVAAGALAASELALGSGVASDFVSSDVGAAVAVAVAVDVDMDGGGTVRSLWQYRHLMASSWISSAQ